MTLKRILVTLLLVGALVLQFGSSSAQVGPPGSFVPVSASSLNNDGEGVSEDEARGLVREFEATLNGPITLVSGSDPVDGDWYLSVDISGGSLAEGYCISSNSAAVCGPDPGLNLVSLGGGSAETLISGEPSTHNAVAAHGEEALPTDMADFTDTELVVQLIAESIELSGVYLGAPCLAPGKQTEEVPPFYPVVRMVDGECFTGGFISRGQLFPSKFGPPESVTELGWQPDWDSVPIFDDQGKIVGDFITGVPVYFEE